MLTTTTDPHNRWTKKRGQVSRRKRRVPAVLAGCGFATLAVGACSLPPLRLVAPAAVLGGPRPRPHSAGFPQPRARRLRPRVRGAELPRRLARGAARPRLRGHRRHLRVVDVWKSAADFDRFVDQRLGSAISETLGDRAAQPERGDVELHSFHARST